MCNALFTNMDLKLPAACPLQYSVAEEANAITPTTMFSKRAE